MDRLWSFLAVPTSRTVAAGVAIAVLAAGTLAYVLVFRLLARFTRSTKTDLDDILVRRMRVPALALVIVLAIHAYIAMRGAPPTGPRRIVLVLELLLTTYLGIEAIETLFVAYYLQEKRQIQVPAVIRHVLLVILYGVAVLSILGTVAGIDLLPVLATSTVVTAVVGLALQDTLGNLIAGLALHLERPFALGDWILVDGIEGKVVYMGWRSTRLRTFSWDIVALPNSVIAKARVQNFYAPDKICSRTVEQIVTLEAAPPRMEAAVEAAAQSVARILREPKPKIWLVQQTPLYQKYVIRFWMNDFQVHDDVESDFMKALWVECTRAGLSLASGAALPAAELGRGDDVAALLPPRAPRPQSAAPSPEEAAPRVGEAPVT